MVLLFCIEFGGIGQAGMYYDGEGNVYQSRNIYDVMMRKIKKIGSYLKSNKSNVTKECTIMLIYNKLEVYWLQVPCETKLLEEATVFCMGKSRNYYKQFKTRDVSLTEKQKDLEANYVDRGNPYVSVCGDLTYIGKQSICDGYKDCSNGDDETWCNLPHNIPSHTDICKIISFEGTTSHLTFCPDLTHITAKNKSCSNPLQFVNDLTINFTGFIHPIRDISKAKCVYESNVCGAINSFPNGDHLLECEQHVCDGQYKKCPGFYCVPLRTVCDGKWNCPGGTDEENCERVSCPGHHKCQLSAVCVHVKSICDNITDCPVHEDEAFCEHELPACPLFCLFVTFK